MQPLKAASTSPGSDPCVHCEKITKTSMNNLFSHKVQPEYGRSDEGIILKDVNVLFSGADETRLFQKRDYMVHCEIGRERTTTEFVVASVKTGAGPSLKCFDYVSRKLNKKIRTIVSRPQQGSASGQSLHVAGVLTLFLRLSDDIFFVRLGVVDGPAVDFLLGTSFIGPCLLDILLQERRIIPTHSRQVAILISKGVEIEKRRGTNEIISKKLQR